MLRFFRPHWPGRRPWPWALGLLLALLICAGGYGALQLHQRALAASAMTRTICIALETSPRLRLGIVWTAPIFSYIPSLMLAPHKACVEMPFSLAPGASPWLPREWLLIP
ncbi:MAG: hypothetical protein HGA45_24635 [Chloroflexales bacterium]|nr:hypothetical protein [Chloroflexales bacterium]